LTLPSGKERVRPAGATRSADVEASVGRAPLGDQTVPIAGADAHYRVLVEEMNEGAVTVSPEGTVLFCNRRFAELTGTAPERITGAMFESFLVPRHAAAFLALLQAAREGASGGEVIARAADGTLVPLRLSMNELPGGESGVVCIVATDLTEAEAHERQLRDVQGELERRIAQLASSNRDLLNSRAAAVNMMEDAVEAREAVEAMNEQLRREIAEREGAQATVTTLEHQFRQAQKMEAVGQLAGGIAHDFNNILTAILGYSDLVLDKAAGDPELAADATEIKRAGERAARLTQQLLAFSRKQMVVPRLIDINEVLGGTEKMVRRVIGEDVQFVMALAPELNIVLADPGLVEQLVLNLVVNARDAMPLGGTLTISTANRTIDDEFVARHPGSAAGEHVAITVADSGCGMPPEVIERIFEPFFTTKGSGKGTGLGLSTVYGIAKQSNGYIQVESRVGAGTTFTLFLPRAAGSADAPASSPPVAESLRGTETILVVEDETFVRSLIRRTLEPRGYSVLDAGSAQEALAIEKAYEGTIHLLLTDIIMPDMNGPTLASAVQVRRPDVRVLYMSGFADHTAVDLSQVSASGAFLQKPFAAEALAAKVRQKLDAPLPPQHL
jgi:PAS domain S-box-containing protein